MTKKSAGLLLYRRRVGELEVLLAHPGGPFWVKRDLGAWTIPKGEYPETEEPLDAARREFGEETGFAPQGEFRELGTIRQKGGKLVTAWAIEGEFDPALLRSNTFLMEWPRGSGQQVEMPEVDRAAWYSIEEARVRILESQQPFLDTLVELVK